MSKHIGADEIAEAVQRAEERVRFWRAQGLPPDEAPGSLRAQLTFDMVVQYYRAGLELGFWDGYYIRAIRNNGGLATLRAHLAKDWSNGLGRLAAAGRYDLMSEALAAEIRYRPLLSSREVARAVTRAQPPHTRKE